MGLFGEKISKEEKKEKEIEKFVQKYHLDSLDDRDLETVKEIAADLTGSNLIKIGTSLGGKPEDTAKICYLSALVEQNWMIINQLGRIAKALESK